MIRRTVLLIALLLIAAQAGLAATHYVDLNSPSPTAPFTNWVTAAHIIQDAVDAALAGDEVLVTNGLYNTGGRVVYGQLTNRVAVTKPILLHSANGPSATVIHGYQVPGTITGDDAVRCVYLTNGAFLSGFTIVNGGTLDARTYDSTGQSGGGVFCESAAEMVSNCVVTGNSAFAAGGGSFQGNLNNCALSNNSASQGGGCCGGTLNGCTLAGNSAGQGGGAYGSRLRNCELSNNSASWGGGASVCTLSNCTLTSNSAEDGGGSDWSELTGCVLAGNSASDRGGGDFASILTSCTVIGNSAFSGGGTLGVFGDSWVSPRYAVLNDCIVYFNTADDGPLEDNYGPYTVLNHCCTRPMPSSGSNNIAADPLLTDVAHLSLGSPCRGVGSVAEVSANDIDGELWADPPSIGCDEYHPGATGPLQVCVNPENTNVAKEFMVNFSGTIVGHATSNRWDFGDGIIITSSVYRPIVSHAWTHPGSYLVTLSAYNDTFPTGVSATIAIQVATQRVYYVSEANSKPVPPYSSWATAASNIQDAVDVAAAGALVLVTNGVYATGGRIAGRAERLDSIFTRVVADKHLTLRSINGPQFTFITADSDTRCAYLDRNATLCGFTLSNGYAVYGGGVACGSYSALVTNCVLMGNIAQYFGGGVFGGALVNCTLISNQAESGGGAYLATLQGCMLTSNAAQGFGGGAYYSSLTNCTLSGNLVELGWGASGGGAAQSTLSHCTLTGNYASEGGGAAGSTLDGCTLTGNSAAEGGGAYSCVLNNCCLSENSVTNGGYGSGKGGGAYVGILNNCTLLGNTAQLGGGAAGDGDISAGICALNNCIVYLNAAQSAPNYDTNCALNYCCTTPLPTNSSGNITNAPFFVDVAIGNLRLQPNSPCINAGNNSYLANSDSTNLFDLDGNPRISGGTVDVGAYEFQNPTSVISYAWLHQYGLPTDGSADFTDTDADGLNNWQEWRCGTDPTNVLSALRVKSVLPTGTNVTVTWQSVAGVNYFLERSTNISGPTPVFIPVTTSIPGQDGTTFFIDTNAVGAGPIFYRVAVRN